MCSIAGSFDSFMQKEIFEQPESVVNTMRGRIFFDTNTGEEWSQTLPCPLSFKDMQWPIIQHVQALIKQDLSFSQTLKL